MWCSTPLANRIVDVDFVSIGQGTLGNSVGADRPAPVTPYQPERYRLNVAFSDMAIAKPCTWPKDTQLIQRLAVTSMPLVVVTR
jgi:hypothetical protein